MRGANWQKLSSGGDKAEAVDPEAYKDLILQNAEVFLRNDWVDPQDLVKVNGRSAYTNLLLDQHVTGQQPQLVELSRSLRQIYEQRPSADLSKCAKSNGGIVTLHARLRKTPV